MCGYNFSHLVLQSPSCKIPRQVCGERIAVISLVVRQSGVTFHLFHLCDIIPSLCHCTNDVHRRLRLTLNAMAANLGTAHHPRLQDRYFWWALLEVNIQTDLVRTGRQQGSMSWVRRQCFGDWRHCYVIPRCYLESSTDLWLSKPRAWHDIVCLHPCTMWMWS